MKLVHTCIRVRDIDASLRFYEALGFERRASCSSTAYNIYLGLPGDGDTLELTVNEGQRSRRHRQRLRPRRDRVDDSTRSPSWPSRGTSRRSRRITRADATSSARSASSRTRTATGSS